MNANELQDHMFSTYVNIRLGMALIAIFSPPLLWVVGKYYGIELEASMSHYYFSLAADDLTERAFPMRAWFVGLLFALGIFLFLYKGFRRDENYVLDAAGICALGVAIFPKNSGDDWSVINSLHIACAVLLFLCMGYVVCHCANDTLPLLQDENLEASYRNKYRWCFWIMIASLGITLLVPYVLPRFRHRVFFIEAAGVEAFGFYWFWKSRELSRSGAEKLALAGQLQMDPAQQAQSQTCLTPVVSWVRAIIGYR